MPPKSIKLYWNEKNVNSGDVLKVLFGDRKDTLATARLLISRMRANPNLAMTKRELRFFAKELQSGKSGVKYSYHNFYTKLLRKLLDLGFLDRNVLVWDAKHRRTAAVYQLRLQAIPERPPQGGFVKQTWQLARGWNELIAK